MLKILIVDDSSGWRNFNKTAIENIFSNQEIEIILAESAKDGYDKLLFSQDKPFDLIITDLQMESDFTPMIAGEWFVRQVKNFPKFVSFSLSLNCYGEEERIHRDKGSKGA